MIKKTICVVLCFIFIIISFPACKDDDTLNIVYPISADPECVDPQIADNDTSLLIVRNCMEGLVRTGSDGSILSGAASDWIVSEDGLKYTFKLKQDGEWQKLNAHKKFLGEDCFETFDYRVTADDFAFGIIRALRPETKAKDAYMLNCIKNAKEFSEGSAKESDVGIEAVDDYTLTVSLSRKNDDFLRLLSMPLCMPCKREFFEKSKAKYGLEIQYTLFNGPFYIGKWVKDNSVTLFKSEVYKSDSEVKTDAVYMYINTNENQYLSKFTEGDYNVVSFSDSGYSQFSAGSDIVIGNVGSRTYGFLFNCKDSVISNNNLRKALVYATDTDSLDNKDDITCGIVPEICRYGNSGYRDAAGKALRPKADKTQSLDYFNKALEELDSVNLSISIVCTDEYRNDVIRLLQNWEKTFGFSMSVSTNLLSQQELDEAVKSGTYQIAFTHIDADNANSLTFLKSFTTDNEKNIASFSDENYDSIIDFCENKASGKELLSSLLKAENIIISDGIFYPVYHGSTKYAFRNSLNGLFFYDNNRILDFSLRGS